MILNSIKISSFIVCVFTIFCSQSFAKDVIKETSSGGVNWSDGIIFSYGYGAVPKRFIGSPKGKLIARRIAITEGLRSLAETTEGVQLTSESTVKDGLLVDDTIKTAVEGLIRGAEEVDSTFEDNIFKVKLAMPISGKFVKTLIPREKFYNLVNNASLKDGNQKVNANATVGIPDFSINNDRELEVAKKILKLMSERGFEGAKGILENNIKQYETQTVYSGLIVDASGVPGFEMATIPFLKTQNGKSIYPSKNTDYDFATKNRVVSYDFDVDDAIKNKRVATVPFIVKALNTYKSKKSDLVISDEDAKRINSMTSISSNISKAKVIIVVSE